LLLLTVCSVALLVKTGMDFSVGSYSRTGLRFKLGAYLLPAIMTTVFAYSGFRLVKAQKQAREVTSSESQPVRETDSGDALHEKF